MERKTNYVGNLQEAMVKYGINPQYEEIPNSSSPCINTFTMRLSCRILGGGSQRITYGEGLSKKDAKQEAARIFMEKYLNKNNSNSSENKSQQRFNCVINVSVCDIPMILQIICVKYNLEKPEFINVQQAGPSHAPIFTVACKVSNLRMEGKGRTKKDAKLEAMTNMIKSLMEAQEICEIFEAPQSKSSMISNEIVCLADGLTVSHIANSMSIFGKRRLHSQLSELFQEMSVQEKPAKTAVVPYSSPKSPDTSENSLFDLISTMNKIEKSVKSLDGSISDLRQTKLENNIERKLEVIEVKSRSFGNLSKCGCSRENNKSPTILDESLLKSSRLKAMNKIDKALEEVENQLYNEILDTVEHRDAQPYKTVIILSNEFNVYINHGRQLKISDGKDSECNDQSIRIACLTKILLDLKEHIRNNFQVPRKFDPSVVSR